MVEKLQPVIGWGEGGVPRAAIGPEWNLAGIGWSRERSAAIGGKGSGRLAALRLWRGGGAPVTSSGSLRRADTPPPSNPIGLSQPNGVPAADWRG